MAAAEAHDSGLCAEPLATRRQFAQDLENLTLADPQLNRHQKSDKDLAEWLPPQNRCWYVTTVVKVKAKYGLTMDSAEAAVARRLLSECGDQTGTESTTLQETSVSSVTVSGLYVVLRVDSNFRARPGVENNIVGGARAGRAYLYVATAGDTEGAHWYQIKLPKGWGWIRSDLANLEWR